MKIQYWLLFFIAIVSSSCNKDTEQLLKVDYEVLATGFKIPWGIAIIGEEEFLFTERLGELFLYKNGAVTAVNYIPASKTVESAGLIYGGLMDVSLHPRFEDNRLVYISYVASDWKMVVARFKLQNEFVHEFEVIFQSNAFSIGSRIAWQDDVHFFVTQGLGGTPYPEPGPQDLKNDGGKIHRLMEDGQIPEDNPIFPGHFAPSSIWSYGHRDPQGLYYDAESEVLFSNEHGPLGGDELNIITKAGNFGWPLFSYGLNYDETPVSNQTEVEAAIKTILPIKHWDRHFNLAPSSLLKISNSQFPQWDGNFLMGSLAKQRLVAYNMETDKTEILLDKVGRVRDIAQLPSGKLLLLIDARSPKSSDKGRIIKLIPK